MKKSILVIIIFSFHYQIYGQISTMEEPVSFKTKISAFTINEKSQKILPSLDMNKIRQEDKEAGQTH